MYNEQIENDKFVKLCGSVAKADRVQQIWNNYRYDSDGERFKTDMKQSGFSQKVIDAFLKLR